LGLYAVKTELEDLSLKYRFPEQYKEISLQLRDKEEHRKYLVEQFITPIEEQLKKENLHVAIKGGQNRSIPFGRRCRSKRYRSTRFTTLLAIRIVFKADAPIDERRKCWEIFSIVTSIYKYKQDRIRDWITMPKANGYEALHRYRYGARRQMG
jgi:GTP diphosphokinase / guanosine-3',5'-bis(diphosphate) 3'-diphosphatase